MPGDTDDADASSNGFRPYPHYLGKENRRRLTNLNDEMDQVGVKLAALDKRSGLNKEIATRLEEQLRWITNLLVGNLLALLGILVAGVITLIANLA